MKKLIILAISLFLFGFIIVNFIEIEAARPSYNVTVTALYDTGNQPTTDLGPRVYGSTVTPYTGAPAGYEFAYWIVNGVVQENVFVDSEFIVTTTMNLVAVFAPTTPQQYAVIFMDSNGKVIETQYVLPNGNAVQPVATLPTKPLFTIALEANRWKTAEGRTALTNITQHELFILQYVSANSELYTIGVTNGFGDGDYSYNEVVIATPDTSAHPFNYWVDADGVVLSYFSTYQFTAVADTTITAVTSDTPVIPETIVTLSPDLEIRSGYHTYMGRFEAAEGDNVLEYGFLISDQAEILTFDTPGVTVAAAKSSHPETFEFVTSFPIGSHLSIRAYVVIKDFEENIINIYSDVNHRYIDEVLYETGFEGVTKGSYAVGDVLIGSVTWTLSDTLIGDLANDRKFDLKSARTQASGFLQSKSTFTNLTEISFYTAKYGTDGNAVGYVYVSDDGLVWVDVTDSIPGGIAINSTTLTQFTANLGQSQNFRNSDIPANEPLYVKISKTGGTRVNFDGISINGVYKGDVHDITYNNESNLTYVIVKDNGTLTQPTVTKLGYTLNRWKDASEVTYVFGTTVTSSFTLFAEWVLNTYDITYNLDSGTNDLDNPASYNVNTSTITLDPATKTGYTFDGWYSNSRFTGDAVTSIPQGSTGNIALYAKFTVNQYTITFDSNEGSAVTAITQNYGTSVSAPADPTRSGFTFDGWYTDDTTFLNAYTFSTMPAQSVTVYAKWNEVAANESTVTFNSNGGSAVTAITQEEGTSVSAPTDPTKAGYTFAGWKLGSEDKSFPFNMPAEDITLDAQWTIVTYDITYILYGGTNGANPATYTVATATITLIAATKEGNTFGGWYDNSGLTGDEVTSIVLGSTGNKTLYAKWNELLPIVLRQSDFGETNNSSSTYANFYIENVENGSEDSAPTSNSSYSRAGGNYNAALWDYIALGQKSVAARIGDMVTSNSSTGVAVDASDPNVYLATRFTLNGVNTITIRVNILKASTTIYLQTSTDGTNWSDLSNIVQTTAIASDTNLSFTGISITGDIYYRIVFVNSTSTSSNGWLGQVKSLTFYQNP
jgi:uncharacterized repeat protein (TIGR02543 family)